MINYQNRSTGHPIADALLSGFGAGSVFIFAQMIISAALGGSVTAPLRMISTIWLGPQVLNPSYPSATAVSVGLLIHGVLSIVFGLLFLFLVIMSRQTRATRHLIVYGFFYGIALWLVNFYLIAPRVFPQFLAVNQIWSGFVAHSLFYGVPLGWCISEGRVRPPLEMELPRRPERRYG